jgi:hypothetical protein
LCCLKTTNIAIISGIPVHPDIMPITKKRI